MGFDVVRGNIIKIQPTNELIKSLSIIFSKDNDATLYLGYPLSANSETKITVDALLISEQKGLIAFNFPNSDLSNIDKLYEEQDDLYFALDYNFKKYPSLKKKRGRDLAFKPNVITWLPSGTMLTETDEEYIFANDSNLQTVINEIEGFDINVYPLVNEALQKVSNIKPRKKRENVIKHNSKGSIIRTIEKEIANLDTWQKKAALEIPDGPQRIRGLAGSGKTIVLALKAAYLHSQYPNWKIAVTFYTRSLAQQYEDLIRKFSFEFSGEEPNENLMIIHAWGSVSEQGIYSIASNLCNISPMNLSAAQSKYGRNFAFDGACKDLLGHLDDSVSPIFDAILIDEAQDMPIPFFRICHKIVKDPKRLIWAYDELQNLTEAEMPSLEEIFGIDRNGNLNVNLESEENEPKRDITLPVCYRNPPWTLSLAHSLGFGLYRKKRKVQMFADLDIWENIGYKIESGNLSYNEDVTLTRRKEASPKYFKELLTIEDSLICKKFDTHEDQYSWVAGEIKKNLEVDELDADDILVIFPDAYYSKSQYNAFRSYLISKGISSILVGINSSRDIFRIPDNISCSSIFRAKGNEAPMVYVVNSDYTADGLELIKLRNILFTAITRSRAWVRICGVGEEMSLLEEEFNECVIQNKCKLKFTVPSEQELKRMRRINRDRSESETKKINSAQKSLQDIISDIESGAVDPEAIPELEALANLLKQSYQKGNNYEE